VLSDDRPRDGADDLSHGAPVAAFIGHRLPFADALLFSWIVGIDSSAVPWWKAVVVYRAAAGVLIRAAIVYIAGALLLGAEIGRDEKHRQDRNKEPEMAVAGGAPPRSRELALLNNGHRIALRSCRFPGHQPLRLGR
jgi:hypothetical protein